MAVTRDVDSEALFSSARVFTSVRTSAGAAVTGLASSLNGSAGMAGTDTGAHAWAARYDPLAKALMKSAAADVQGAGQCSDLLFATGGVNHLNADGQSAINNETVLEMPPMGAPAFPEPTIPSAEGGHADVPGWWHTISAYVEGELWPNGHQDKLRAAADAWSNAVSARGGLRASGQLVNGGPSSMGAIAPLLDQKSPEFPDLIKNCTMVRDHISGTADGFDDAAKVCSSYAQTIDDAHSKIIHEMLVLGATVAVSEVIAAVLIPFTAGASEAVSKVVDVSRLTATGARIVTIIREFRAAAELSALPAVSAAGFAARSITELGGPLLAARPTIFAAEVAGRGATRAEAAEAQRLAEQSVKDKLEKKYLLNPDHPTGGPKAKWFEQALASPARTPQIFRGRSFLIQPRRLRQALLSTGPSTTR